jgi:nitrate/TMAO reductase-like tetraheme cytochrome c subunit
VNSQVSAHTLLVGVSLACAAGAAGILLWFLIRHPRVGGATKLLLLVGIGILPIGTAVTSNVANLQASASNQFCGSCHVMTPYTTAALDRKNVGTAALHTRNQLFGDESCYGCHSDYKLFGTIKTKLTGMRHMWAYYQRHSGPSPAKPGEIHLYKPFANDTCTRCHSGTLPGFKEEGEHGAVADKIKQGTISCTTADCHGPAHRRREADPATLGGLLMDPAKVRL